MQWSSVPLEWVHTVNHLSLFPGQGQGLSILPLSMKLDPTSSGQKHVGAPLTYIVQTFNID